MRLDKWLWAARFFKTRNLAQQAIASGKVRVDELRVKPSQEVKLGSSLAIRIGDYDWKIAVRGLSEKRGPAAQARLLYEESQESRAERERRMDIRRFSPEPAKSIKGRPTKKDRRELDSWTGQPDES